jgi:hypothetical protein
MTPEAAESWHKVVVAWSPLEPFAKFALAMFVISTLTWLILGLVARAITRRVIRNLLYLLTILTAMWCAFGANAALFPPT